MEEQKTIESQERAKHFMVFYVIALFAIALVLILLSYVTQTRADDQIASAQTQLQQQVSATQGVQAKLEVLQSTNTEQAARIAELEQTLEQVNEENIRLVRRSEAEAILLRAASYARSDVNFTLMQKALDELLQTYTLDELDGSNPLESIWTVEDAHLFNELRRLEPPAPTAEPEEEKH